MRNILKLKTVPHNRTENYVLEETNALHTHTLPFRKGERETAMMRENH